MSSTLTRILIHIVFSTRDRLPLITPDVRGELYEYIRGIVHRKSFYWQRGYGVFSVSESIRPVVERYIQNQEKHHARHGYQSEFRQLLKRHGVPHEEEHLWD